MPLVDPVTIAAFPFSIVLSWRSVALAVRAGRLFTMDRSRKYRVDLDQKKAADRLRAKTTGTARGRFQATSSRSLTHGLAIIDISFSWVKPTRLGHLPDLLVELSARDCGLASAAK
jgi:hypothetical protein